MSVKIGIKQVLAMEPHTILWDTSVKGFNARRQFGDAITFSVFYRSLEGTQRWHRIGRFGVWSPDQARREAQRVLRARDLGEDPSGARMAVKASPTVAELLNEYVADMDSGKLNGKKASTIYSDKNRIKQHIAPHLGKLKVASVTQDDVEAFMHQLSPGSAKRIIGLTGAIFTYAVKKKLRLDNPVKGIETPKENKRMRRLSKGEYQQIWNAINSGAAHQTASDIFQLLLVTGWRSGEAKNLKFSELDLERRVATLGDTKTGVSIRPLSSAAIEIIKRQKTTGVYVFEHKGTTLGFLHPYWQKLQMPTDVTPHTLRHSFASLAADLGFSDNVIAGMLGHARSSITSRYVHLEAALIMAADAVGAETLRLMRA
jgi:integrase